MTAPTARPGRPKALVLLPLAALSLGWAIHSLPGQPSKPARLSAATHPLTGAPVEPGAAGAATPPATGPAPAVPAPWQDAVVVPAGGQGAGAGAPQVHGGIVAAAATMADIPAVALAAYQRAAGVIDQADASCHLDWTLLAAIGRVESDHGRHGGSTLGTDGIATPAIIGPALDGSAGTARVGDTDGGQYDGDTRLDHAVGPMQILPATWSVVGVDADGDGKRDPQDVNDAALAAAVYLCAGGDDLATPAGQEAAVFRYNHAQAYVATVLAVAAAYQQNQIPVLTAPAILTRMLVPPPPLRPPHGIGKGSGASSKASGKPAGHGHAAHGNGHGAGHGQQPAQHTAPAPTASGPAPVTSTPAPAPAPTPAPAVVSPAVLAGQCRSAILDAYPDATSDAVARAVELCVGKLAHATPEDLRSALADVVAALVQSVPALKQAPSPAPSPSPDPAPSGDSGSGSSAGGGADTGSGGSSDSGSGAGSGAGSAGGAESPATGG